MLIKFKRMQMYNDILGYDKTLLISLVRCKLGVQSIEGEGRRERERERGRELIE